MRTKRLSVVLCALLVVGLSASTLAGADWGTPVNLSEAGQDADQHWVAIDADGDAVFTWVRFDGSNFRVQAQARAADGTLSTVKALSSSGQDASQPQVAVDADGDAVIIWRRFDGTNFRVQGRARAADGTLSSVQTLSDAGQDASEPQVGVDADGDAVFTWQRFDGTNDLIEARTRASDGTLTAVETLSDAGQDAADPQVAVDPDGDAVFTWERFDGTDTRVQARARAADGTLSSVQTFSRAGQDAVDPQVAVNADGDAVFTWRRSDGTHSRVRARARAADGTLSPVQTLSRAGQGGFDPQLAVDADGDAVFTWRRSDAADFRIEARTRAADGSLTPVEMISAAGADAYFSEVAVDADGDAVLTWVRFDGADFRVEARTRTAAGTLLPVTIVSDPGAEGVGPQLAVNADGHAVIAWWRFDGANSRIQATTRATEWTPVEVSDSDQGSEPDVAVDDDGDAVLVWQRFDGTNHRIEAQVRSADGTLSSVQALSRAGQDAFDPKVAVDDGDAVFTWHRFDGTNDRVQTRARAADGTLSAVQNLSDAGEDGRQPQVAIDADGDAVFTWRRLDGTNLRIEARTRAADGTLSAVETLSDAGQDAADPQVAIDDGGDAVFTWRRFNGTDERVQTRARAADGTLSSVQTLSSSGQNAFDPQVAVDADGDAVFTWRRSDGTDDRVQARARAADGTLSSVQTLSAAGEDGVTPQVAVDSDGDAVFTWQWFDGTNFPIEAQARAADGTLSSVQTLSSSGQNAFDPQVAVDADGDAVFAWQRFDGADFLAETRTRTAAGDLRPLTTLSDPGADAVDPQVAVGADGDAVFAWVSAPFGGIQAWAGP